MPRSVPRSVLAAVGLKCNLGPPLYFKKGEGQERGTEARKVVPGQAEADGGEEAQRGRPKKRGGGATPRSQARTPKAQQGRPKNRNGQDPATNAGPGTTERDPGALQELAPPNLLHTCMRR